MNQPKQRAIDYVNQIQQQLSPLFEQIDDTVLYNQNKVLEAFQECRVSARHFNFSTGYGYDDDGKNTLCAVFARTFGAEAALVSPLITSGTQALTVALFGLLRTGDTLLAVSGKPYDTLDNVINGKDIGSLVDYGIRYKQADLNKGQFDKDTIGKLLTADVKVVFIGRSRGYEWRDALSIDAIADVITFVKSIKADVTVLVDNCYGEFVDKREPTQVGADVIAGSLIKNPGGGLAVTGGYIVGTEEAIDKISGRLTAPSVKNEVGSYYSGYLPFYQGFFIAPHVVGGAIKGSSLMAKCFASLGFDTLPTCETAPNDIICSIKMDTEQQLVTFCQTIQQNSPVDSYVLPEPWEMPGYNHQVIMAAGTFVQGASIELSCDSPIKAPYIAYLQGGITYEHIKLALIRCLQKLFPERFS